MNQYLIQQYQLHPSMQPEDILKMTYQATFGAEHLLLDADRAGKYLAQEFQETEAKDIPLYEEISEEYSRLNIAAWKYQQRSQEDYFQLFVSSLPNDKRTKEDFVHLLQENIVTAENFWPMPKVEALKRMSEELLTHLGPIHHSQEYRQQENPHYRIVKTDLLKKIL